MQFLIFIKCLKFQKFRGILINKNFQYNRKPKDRGPRTNNNIRALEVQLIGHEGENIGIVPLGEAINRAQEVGLDLIEIAPNTKPPVCKIMDSGKFKYEQQKKANLARKKQKIINLKEIKLRPVTDVHDYDFKIKNAQKFLTSGDKVKFTIKFNGREMEYMKAAYDLVRRIIEDTKELGKVEQAAKMEGRQMTLIIQALQTIDFYCFQITIFV